MNEVQQSILKESKKISKEYIRKNGVKVSNCGNYLMIEKVVFSVKSGKIIQNHNLLTERTWGEWTADWAQTAASVASAFIPGSGILVETINALIYWKRAEATSDKDRQGMLYTNAFISLGFALFGNLLAPIGWGLKALMSGTAIKLSIKFLGVIKSFIGLLGKLANGLLGIINKLIVSPLAKKALGEKWLTMLSAKIMNGSEIVKSYLTKKFMSKAGKSVSSAVVAGAAPSLSTAKELVVPTILARFKTMFSKLISKKTMSLDAATQWMNKFGFKQGKNYPINLKSTSAELLDMAKGVKQTSVVGRYMGLNAGGNVASFATKHGRVSIPVIELPNAIMRTFKMPAITATNAGTGKIGVLLYNMYRNSGGAGEPDFNDTPKFSPEEGSKLLLDASGLNIEDVGVADYEGDSQNYTVKNEVSAVQTALQDVLGISVGSTGIDGKYGPATKEAIQQALDTSGFPMETKMTAKSVIGIGVAILLKKGIGGKTAVSELFNKAITDSEALNAANQIINNSKSTADFMAQKLMSLAGVTQKTFDTPMTEGTFHENYKRIFG